MDKQQFINIQKPHFFNKIQTKRLSQLIKYCNITTIAEMIVLEHIYYRDIHRSILVHDYNGIKEIQYSSDGSRWVRVTIKTNKHCFDFHVLAESLEKGDERDLWHKID